MSRRTDRVGDLIRAELSQVLLRQVRDPRVKLASVTDVDVSRDLRHALISVSVVGTDAERRECIEALRSASGFIRSQLAKKLYRLKNIPALRFELDRGAEYSQRISELLENPDDIESST